MRSTTVHKYLEELETIPLLDVRSPAEFQKGHIPSAMNLPLFSDAERAEVGTLYKQKSKETAMMKGLEIAGAKMSWYVKEAKRLVDGSNIALHCWRGGKRSSSMATLLEFTGNKTTVIEGGYKAYRNYILHAFSNELSKLIVIGGATGSGKTELLHELKKRGEQVVDLEKIAHHKGSAFGALGEKSQPTVEQFENDLFEVIRKLDTKKRIWVENESNSIGRVFIPAGFWDQLCQAFLIELEVPFENRVERLIRIYADFPKEKLIGSLEKIRKRLGGLNIKNAIAAYEANDMETAAGIALKYYDKAYLHATQKKKFKRKESLNTHLLDTNEIADQLIQLAQRYDY
ncbi:MAG: tRNA 2-selenouridine(34) synthase MnmH [Bacteroidota bacterium]